MTKKYSKICVKRPLSKRPKNSFQGGLSLNAGQKYCRMPRGALCNNFDHHEATNCHNDLCFVYFEWPFYTGFTVCKSSGMQKVKSFTAYQDNFAVTMQQLFYNRTLIIIGVAPITQVTHVRNKIVTFKGGRLM